MEFLLKPLQDIYEKRSFLEYQYRYAWEDGSDASFVPPTVKGEPPRLDVKEDDTMAPAAATPADPAAVHVDHHSEGEGKGGIYGSRHYPHTQQHDAWKDGTNDSKSSARSHRNGSVTAVPPATMDEDARKPAARPNRTEMAAVVPAAAVSVGGDSEGEEKGGPSPKVSLELEEDDNMEETSDWNGCDI
jgi:hypothetical protein